MTHNILTFGTPCTEHRLYLLCEGKYEFEITAEAGLCKTVQVY